MRQISPEQGTFCQEYVKYGNASRAYRIAYPKSQKWTDEAVWVKACRAKKRANVRLRIEELRKKLEKKFEASVARSVRELSLIAYNDPKNVMNPTGGLNNIHDIPEVDRRAIKSIRHVSQNAKGKDDVKGEPITKVHYDMYDKNKANEILIRQFGGFEKDNQQRAVPPSLNINYGGDAPVEVTQGKKGTINIQCQPKTP